jgi:hypothetical protein
MSQLTSPPDPVSSSYGDRAKQIPTQIATAPSLQDFRDQLEVVQSRYIGRSHDETREAIHRVATVSTDMNVALAAANNGEPAALIRAILAVLSLGPYWMNKYFRYSRIVERVVPRLRARFARSF